MIGWTYESNEEAIAQAKENLDELDTQKKQDDIQAQIDYHEQLKTIMENLESEKEAAKNQKMLTEWFKESGYSDANGMVAAIVDGFGKQLLNTNLFNKDEGDEQLTDTSDVEKKMEAEKQQALEDLNNTNFTLKEPSWDNVLSGKQTIDQYNDAVSDYNKALSAAETKIEENEINIDSLDDEIYSNIKTAIKRGHLKNKLNGFVSSEVVLNVKSLNGKFKGGEAARVLIDGKSEGVWIHDPSQTGAERREAIEGISDPEMGNVAKDPISGKNYVYIKDYKYEPDGWYLITDAGGEMESTINKEINERRMATGEESFAGGPALINELGTEAIITPSGTVTALPSKTGVVPADITKNLWSLGEIAPTLVAQLSSLNQKPVTANAGNTTYEEGQYFDHFTMNVYPAKGDDLTEILKQARANVALTRHNN